MSNPKQTATQPAISVENSVALVTGANRGIGKTIVETFLKLGAKKVYAAVRRLETAEPLVAEFGDKIVPVQLDATDEASILKAAEVAADVQIVVNNAGILKTEGPLSSQAIDALKQEMDVNVYGLMRVAQAFAPGLKANGGGALVQLNSVASLRTFADFSTYAASKAASYSMTQALKSKLNEQGTAVVSVHPGPIDTDMAHSAGLGDMVEPATLVSDAIVKALESGEFHVFPDSLAKDVGAKYDSFAKQVIEAEAAEEESAPA